MAKSPIKFGLGEYSDKPFELRSGNTPLFKHVGSSPYKQGTRFSPTTNTNTNTNKDKEKENKDIIVKGSGKRNIGQILAEGITGGLDAVYGTGKVKFDNTVQVAKNKEEADNPVPYNKLLEDIKGLGKRVDNIEVKPIHNSTLIEKLKSEIVQLKNEILLDDMEEIIPIPNATLSPKKAVDKVKDIEKRAFEKLEKIWDNFKKEKKPKKKKKFEWTDKKVKDFATNYNTKSIEGCKNVKDKVEYYKQKNK